MYAFNVREKERGMQLQREIEIRDIDKERYRDLFLLSERCECGPCETAQRSDNLASLGPHNAARPDSDHLGGARLQEGRGQLLGQGRFSVRIRLIGYVCVSC